ncbi:MAG TPA: C-terminal helicase domain-containing protein, partial [Thermomicrobiales bacterium]|nr:C-terminal helicase domain-containing protein [Thermomicrobiales bacterium]
TVVDAIDGLRLPRYGLGNYIAARLTPLPNDAERRDLAGLNRAGVRLKGFCRTNLFKRLESGGPAFLQSLERHAIRNFVVLHALEQGLEAPIGTQDGVDFDSRFTDRDADDALPAAEDDSEMPETTPPPLRAEADYRAVGARLFELYRGAARGRFKWLRASLFTSELRDDLLADARAVLDVLDWCGAWEPAHDAKLQALARLIRDEHPHEKILVFTQFADTVAYLERELTRLGITDLAGATAEDPNPARLAWRFSPRSNQQEALAARDGELRVLVATDVLSEGQNLQDAAIVVNYDLPWAIIRLIQRVGRVDRIGQGAEDILCYSFLPAEGIEAILRLRGRLRTRLSANAEVVGTDEAFFEDDVSERPLLDLYNERAGILDEADDLGVDPTSDAYQIWKNAVDANPRLAKIVPALPDVVYATRSHAPLPGQPDGVLLYVRGGDGADSLAWIDEQGRIVTESALDVLRAAACHPDTPALPRSERHHELVESGARQMLAEQANAGGQLGRPSGARFRVYQRLTAYIARLDGQLGMFDPGRTEAGLAPNLDGLKRAVQDIYDHPLLPAATDSLNRLLRANASDEELGRRAIDLRERDELTVPDNDAERREPRIICSLGLVAPPA